MTNREIQEMITVSQWGMWLQYVKKNNVKNEGGHWPDYEFHEFYTSLGWTEVEGEAHCEGGSRAEGGQSVVPSDVPEGHGIGREMVVYSDNNLVKRWQAHDWKPSLQKPSDGPKVVGPSPKPEGGVQDGSEGCIGS